MVKQYQENSMSELTTLNMADTSHEYLADTAVKRQVGRFRETRKAQLMRSALGTLCEIAPQTTASIAYALLSRPPRSPERSWQTRLLESARRSWLRIGNRGIAMHTWGRGPTVLMVHGWGARSTHMGKMIEPLVQAGFRVVSFDAPAHGQSEGRHTDLVEFSAAIAAVARQSGPIHTIVAHSFGVAMALLARRDWGVEAKRQIYISSFDHCKWFTEAFRHHAGISAEVMESTRQMMVERHNGRVNWDQLSVVEMLRRTQEPTLLIHDREDDEIPFQHTVALHEAAACGELFTTSGFGHHRLLGLSSVIDRVVKFVSDETTKNPRL